MATIDLATGINGGYQPSSVVIAKQPYTITKRISFADAATAKGSGLAAADVIKAIDIPAGSCVVNANVKKVDAPTGTVSVATIDLGVTGVDADVFVDGWDYYAAVAGDYGQNPAAFQPVTFTAAGTLDVLLASLTGTLLTGYLDVTALVYDMSGYNAPGLAALRS